MKNFILNSLTLSLFISFKSWGLYISYEGMPINSLREYRTMQNEMNTNPFFTEYLKICKKIGKSSTIDGPFISTNRIVKGAHVPVIMSTFIIDEFRRDGNTREYSLTDKQSKPGTDLAFLYIDELDEDSPFYRSIQSAPILERASIEDIQNSENKFYALSCVLHGSNIEFGYTGMQSALLNVVQCKPTLSNPAVESVLRFEIDDRNNFPLHFRTASGDSGQGFFLVTPDNKLKVVGVHNPGNNYFYVENLAYPPTKLFVNDLIAQDAVPEPISMLILGTGTIFYMKKGLFILRIKKFQQ